MTRMTPEQLSISMSAVHNAKGVLKPGDRILVSRCGGFKATYTFNSWDGNWIVSKSGINDISAGAIEKINGQAFDLTLPRSVTRQEAEEAITVSEARRKDPRHKRFTYENDSPDQVPF